MCMSLQISNEFEDSLVRNLIDDKKPHYKKFFFNYKLIESFAAMNGIVLDF